MEQIDITKITDIKELESMGFREFQKAKGLQMQLTQANRNVSVIESQIRRLQEAANGKKPKSKKGKKNRGPEEPEMTNEQIAPETSIDDATRADEPGAQKGKKAKKK